jgi:hypothetical protein
MSKTNTTERRSLKAHADLILQVIKRQAGTLAKAVMEGVMNAIDAGATTIQIQLKPDRLIITDNGKGFDSADHIKDVFEVFGSPHEMNEEGISVDAKFGTYRIGRGQLFAFGVNEWKSNTFKMTTDINGLGLAYDLSVGQSPRLGCEITVQLYEKLSMRDVQQTTDEVTKLCRYVIPTLTVNGVNIARDPAGMKWDVVTDDAYISKKVSESRWRYGSGLDVYQQGVFVETIPASEYGLEGTIVIKQAVQVNFARNQVIRSCKRWKKIAALLRDTGTKDAVQKVKLDVHKARSFIQNFVSKDIDYQTFRNVQCLPDVRGRMWSMDQLDKLSRSKSSTSPVYANALGHIPVGFGPRNCRDGDRVIQNGKALVLDAVLFQYLGLSDQLSAAECGAAALDIIQGGGTKILTWVAYQTLVEDSSGDYELVQQNKLTPQEQDIISSSAHILGNMARTLGVRNRKLCLGNKANAEGWTDGATYVAISRTWLKGLRLGYERDWHALTLLLAHEMCHDGQDTDTHNHTPQFYEDYHELTRRVPVWARWGYQLYRKYMNSRLRKLPKQIQDQLFIESEAVVLAELAYIQEPVPVTKKAA